MGYRFIALWIGLAAISAAQPASVQSVVDSVRGAIRRNAKDSLEARALSHLQMIERLDDRTIETLESEGAGPNTVAELLHMRDLSVLLPTPIEPVIPAPPDPSPEERDRVWQAASSAALNYTASLPDFICTEVVRRFKDPEGKETWKLDDTLTVKLSYIDHTEDYRLIAINNRKTTLSYDDTGGAISEGEFGSMLNAVFRPQSHTEFHFDHWTTLRKHAALVYAFKIALANSQYRMTFGTSSGYRSEIAAGQHGYVYVDRDTRTVIRVVADADSMPVDFPVKKAGSVLDYGLAEVGGKLYLLPLHAETRLDTMPMQHRNDVQFLNYQKFSADATITFDGVKK